MPTIAPYRLARLVNAEKPITDNTNDRWYIVFYVWDESKNKLVKKRDYGINKYKTKKERLAYSKKAIPEINRWLTEGYVVDDRPREQISELVESTGIDSSREYTLEKAIDLILPLIKMQKRLATYNAYKSGAMLFLEYCKRYNWHKFNVKSICQSDVTNWLDVTQAENKNSNTTRNNNLYHLKSVFSFMKKKGLITDNPTTGIPREDEEEPSRVAYSADQVEVLKLSIFPTNQRLWLFITFILYGFIRPKEIGLLRVKMVDLVKRQIYIPGYISKNKKSAYIKISKPFAKYIELLELEKYSPEDYIFGKGLKTCAQLLPRNRAYVLFVKYLTDLKFGPGYDLYDFKHTGVILHYLAGVDIKSLQAQLRHSSLDETDLYMRSLGLFANLEIEDKSPAI